MRKALQAQSDADIKSQLFNLIAQEDNQLNIQLSRDMRKTAIKTKKDGNTMKIIAVLGTIFLPATFIAVRAPSKTVLQALTQERHFFPCHFLIGLL